jgi:hypothetical protein
MGTMIFGPNFGSRIRLEIWAMVASARTMGRKANPVFTGLKPSVPCR